MSATAIYCDYCGQAKKESKLSISQLFSDFLNNIFNLDGRLFRSIKHVLKPAFLAQEFTTGKRKSYVSPTRFLVVMLVLLFFLLNQSVRNIQMEDTSTELINKVERKRLSEVFEDEMYKSKDSISDKTISQLKYKIFDLKEDSYDDKLVPEGNVLNFEFDGYDVTRKDAFTISADSLFKKYKIKNWKDKYIITQFTKISKNASQGISYIIGNLIWGILISVFLIALLLKVLYIRSNYYYVEHLIVTILYNAKIYTGLNLILLLQMITPDGVYWNYIMAIILLAFSVYFILTLKNYYNQNWFKTIMKSIIIGIVSVYILTFSLILVSFISMAFF